MNKRFIAIDIVISLIIAVALMMRGVMAQNRLMCGIINLTDCGLRQWLIQLLIIFVLTFIIVIIIVSIIKSRMGRIKMPKIKKGKFKIPKEKPMEKIPEFGKDIDLEGVEKEPTKRIKI